MYKPHILIAEDTRNWRDELSTALRQLFENSLPSDEDIILVATEEEAGQQLKRYPFDLAIFDLELQKDFASPFDLAGVQLLGGENLIREMRNQEQNRHCGIIVVSAHVDVKKTDLLRTLGAVKVIDKGEGNYKREELVDAARTAICKSLLAKSEYRHNQSKRVAITFDEQKITSVQLLTPQQRVMNQGGVNSIPFNVQSLVSRANLMDVVVADGPATWRSHASLIGQDIYEKIKSHPDAGVSFTSALAQAQRPEEVWLEFTGTAMGLGVPFEFMQDDTGYDLAKMHLITRQFSGTEHTTRSFRQFIASLIDSKDTLSLLLVGVNSDGFIPKAEIEVEALEKQLKADLKQLGIASTVTTLTGHKATIENVGNELQKGIYHIFHFAGHSNHLTPQPEESGLLLKDGLLAAADLELCVRRKGLQLVYLSSCTGARSSPRGYGNFHGTFDALNRAGVPTVIGFRWSVQDEAAKVFAENFYQELWRTFAPAEALLKARQHAARGRLGRDDDTWLSPIMLMQNP